MDTRPVQLRIGGQSFKVVSSADEGELQRLAETVSAKVEEVAPPGKTSSPQSMMLAAMALAHELEQERERRRDIERRAADMLRQVLVRIDDVLEQ